MSKDLTEPQRDRIHEWLTMDYGDDGAERADDAIVKLTDAAGRPIASLTAEWLRSIVDEAPSLPGEPMRGDVVDAVVLAVADALSLALIGEALGAVDADGPVWNGMSRAKLIFQARDLIAPLTYRTPDPTERPAQTPEVQAALDGLAAQGVHVNTRGCAPMTLETVEAMGALVEAARQMPRPPGPGSAGPIGGPIPYAHPERLCDDCKGPNVRWFGPSSIWNHVVRPHGENGSDPMLCPRCFAVRAFRAGLDVTWKLEPAPTIDVAPLPEVLAADLEILRRKREEGEAFTGPQRECPSYQESLARSARVLAILEAVATQQGGAR